MDATSSYRAATLAQQQLESALADIYGNATSIQDSSQGFPDDSMQSTGSSLGGGAGNRVNNIYIFLMSGSTLTISRSAIFASFDIATQTDWSVSIPISTLAYNPSGDIDFDTNTALNVGTGASGDNVQTIARIPIVRDKKMLNALGVYKEALACKNGEPIVEYYKI
tara:strand:- start:894 stop:1391 length:498 start_codon:yes stop_codon:yes gene_type:complete